MAIIYPLTPPSTPGPKILKLTANNAVGLVVSPFTWSSQVQQWPAEHWEMDVQLPEMAQSAAAPWVAFLTALRGQYGTCEVSDQSYGGARGVATGTPQINGSQSTQAVLLNTKGWTPNTAGILKAGDLLQLGANPNLLLYSEQFDNSAWNKNGGSVAVTVTPNAATDPNGGNSADQISFGTTGSAAWSQIQQDIANLITPGVPFVFSVYLRASAPSSAIALFLKDTSNVVIATDKGCSVTSVWQRFFIAGVAPYNAAAGVRVGIYSPPNTAAHAIYAWGAQLEVGSSASAYWSQAGTVLTPATAHLHMVLADAASDSSGAAMLDIFPRLREPMTDGQPINLVSPVGTFRLAQNKRDWSIGVGKIYSISFSLVEAL